MNRVLNKKTFYYATTLTIALLVGILGGTVDILQTDAVIEASQTLGYPLYFFTLLGICKIMGGTILLLPQRFSKLRDMAYLGFALDFIFASYSFFSVKATVLEIAIPLVLLLVLFISYNLQNKIT